MITKVSGHQSIVIETKIIYFPRYQKSIKAAYSEVDKINSFDIGYKDAVKVVSPTQIP